MWHYLLLYFSRYFSDFLNKCILVFFQVDRRMQVEVISRHRLYTGIREWRKLIHYLIEMECLFGPFGNRLCNPQRVCYWTITFIHLIPHFYLRFLKYNFDF